jgi:hypothetical protein
MEARVMGRSPFRANGRIRQAVDTFSVIAEFGAIARSFSGSTTKP